MLDFYGFFLDFYLIFIELFFKLNLKKVGLFTVGPRADVARGTRENATRHARPHGRAKQAHAELRWHDVARTCAMGHASPRGRHGGATW